MEWRFFIAALLLLPAGDLRANNPEIRTVDSEYTWQSGTVGSSSTRQIVLTFDPNDTNDWIVFNQFRFDGANASDFRIADASCEAGDSLYPLVPTCTLNIQYTPSFPYAETAKLTITCSKLITGADPMPGLTWTAGFSMECVDNSVGSIPLVGLVAQRASVPALSDDIAIVLATLLAATGVAFCRKS